VIGSPEYRRTRSELLEAEVALMEQRERVAGRRRSLPVTEPCPMCTLWRDGINAVAPHLNRRADLGGSTGSTPWLLI
jgi:predicted dithiol-disulfide oxidoreductase (DUF899 family)